MSLTSHKISIQKVILDVEQYYNLSSGEIKEHSRSDMSVVKARKLAMYLSRKLGYSWHQLADVFNRNHSTAIKVLKRFNRKDFKEELKIFERKYGLTKPWWRIW